MKLEEFFNAMNTATSRLIKSGIVKNRISKHQASKKGYQHAHKSVKRPARYELAKLANNYTQATNHQRVVALREKRKLSD